jgi:hypothetical protein
MLDKLFEIKNLTATNLEAYFKVLGYRCNEHEGGNFLYTSLDSKNTGLYMVNTIDNEIIYCSYTTQDKTDIGFLIEQAIEDYGFTNIPIDEEQSFILDDETMRLSIRKRMVGLVSQTIITLVKRKIPFGQFFSVSLTIP